MSDLITGKVKLGTVEWVIRTTYSISAGASDKKDIVGRIVLTNLFRAKGRKIFPEMKKKRVTLEQLI